MQGVDVFIHLIWFYDAIVEKVQLTGILDRQLIDRCKGNYLQELKHPNCTNTFMSEKLMAGTTASLTLELLIIEKV